MQKLSAGEVEDFACQHLLDGPLGRTFTDDPEKPSSIPKYEHYYVSTDFVRVASALGELVWFDYGSKFYVWRNYRCIRRPDCFYLNPVIQDIMTHLYCDLAYNSLVDAYTPAFGMQDIALKSLRTVTGDR